AAALGIAGDLDAVSDDNVDVGLDKKGVREIAGVPLDGELLHRHHVAGLERLDRRMASVVDKLEQTLIRLGRNMVELVFHRPVIGMGDTIDDENIVDHDLFLFLANGGAHADRAVFAANCHLGKYSNSHCADPPYQRFASMSIIVRAKRWQWPPVRAVTRSPSTTTSWPV